MTESTFPQYPRLVLSKGEKNLYSAATHGSFPAPYPVWKAKPTSVKLSISSTIRKVVSTRRTVTNLPDPRASGHLIKQNPLILRFSPAACASAAVARLAGEKDGTDSYRLIAGESDGLHGVTIDRFGHFWCCNCSAPGPNINAPH